MRPAAVLLALSFACAACGAVETTRPVDVEPGTPFALHAGETARLSGRALLVGFEGVEADSRCPRGEQCIVAGSAVVRVWWQWHGQPRERRELHSAMGGLQAARIGDFDLTLTAIEPPPVAGKPIDKSTYVATFLLGRSTPGDADR
ncbi:hypothetical protein [Roseateles sp.]|uniref:hypothetical protein n=1 Tax=Roseateles sp. TaxID=1971397 RepID=UPI003267D5A8